MVLLCVRTVHIPRFVFIVVVFVVVVFVIVILIIITFIIIITQVVFILHLLNIQGMSQTE